MHPIVSALKHHKTTVVLVALEIALTCAIVTNALFLIGDRVAAMRVVTGVADHELVWARTTGLDLGQDTRMGADIDADLAALRGMPGVESVAMANTLPLSRNYMSVGAWRRPGDKKSEIDNVVEYAGTPGLLHTLGIKLSAGRDFLPQDYVPYTPGLFGSPDSKAPPPTAAIVTHTLAEALWPGENPLGKTFWLDSDGKEPVQVVGVTGHLLNPRITKYQGADRNMILPSTRLVGGVYVLNVRPDMRGAVARDLPGVLTRIDPARMVKAEIYADTIADYYHGDRAMVWVLLVVTGCLLALTALGVVGLSSFWVQQRTRQIGIRRAIGATRRDILRYFQFENLLIVTMGIAVGSLGAVGLNLWLMRRYELAHMPLAWLASGAVVLWSLGQCAVLGPALRASRVPPVVATRTV
ncbi:FtsX-like permease family protein [Rhodanobacter sp. DHB23]|uniref:ABC transporter permease n=1 Tax=Rhodanobacter sp. DHB23 TaxID=2775923 RepID=UPI0017861D0F|nr:FtsX-like permease family protein [Rhodanobacter sp. DHB23]MBD8871546.1 FtsX-like permease family protein [Rhodanobacter sp. DHB23]